MDDDTYVSTWQGFNYVALEIDTVANRIVGTTKRAGRVYQQTYNDI